MHSVNLEKTYGAENYLPLPVTLTRGEGVYLWDEHGERYLDMMSAYSAVSHGHSHPRIVKKVIEQVQQLSNISRAYHSSTLGPFLERACLLTGMDKALAMNTGAEAVETALKAARKWAYTVKKIPGDAEIIVCGGNFHGRTLGIISMSTEPQYRHGFGPFLSGFRIIPFNNVQCLEAAITPNTAAFLVEPIQGEAGIVVPDTGYLKQCADICKRHNVLLIADEVQTGLGRTGALLACQHENVVPDALILGKALSGGIIPVSLFLARNDVMQVFTPGDHGSTFGGNPLAAAVGHEALDVLIEENLPEKSRVLGQYFMNKLKELKHPYIRDVRGKGLFIALEVDINKITAREICMRLLKHKVLSKETHGSVIRLAPPLIINHEQIDAAYTALHQVFNKINEELQLC